MIKVRFAPSPTGLLHVGNARMALINWLFARHHGGRFLLRLDDTDEERSRREYEDAIFRDLAWLGLEWDEEARQSGRLERYDAAAARLKAAGRLYPCYETPEELEYRRRRRLRQGRPPVYDRAALKLDEADRHRLEIGEGRTPHWRFRLEPGRVAWEDLARGHTEVDATAVSDPVLIRADGTYLYSLPSVVDDLELEVTHVLRGEDHVTNTAAQIQIFAALEGTSPAFAHLPLMTAADGAPLSKRLGGLALEELRADGIDPMALVSLLAHLGSSDDVTPERSPEGLVRDFDITHFGRAAPRFDERLLARLNERLLHEAPYFEVADRLRAMGLAHADRAFWEAVRANLGRLEEARDWHAVLFAPITPDVAPGDADFLRDAADRLPPEPWSRETWTTWTGLLKAESGRNGKSLFMPLRKALTGRPRGPELDRLLPLIGRDRAAARLRGEQA